MHEPGPISWGDVQKTTKYVQKYFVGKFPDRDLSREERVSEWRRCFVEDVPLLRDWLAVMMGSGDNTIRARAFL